MADLFVDLARSFLASQLTDRLRHDAAAGIAHLQSAAALLPDGAERVAAEHFIDLTQSWLAVVALTGESDPVRLERLVENLDALAAIGRSG